MGDFEEKMGDFCLNGAFSTGKWVIFELNLGFLKGKWVIFGLNGGFSKRDRKSTRLNSSHLSQSRMPSSA